MNSATVRNLLVRGMLAGLAAGVLMWLFGLVFGEPQIRTAIAFEEAMSPPSDEAPLVSRSMQETLGLLTGTIVYAVAIGGIFALVFAGEELGRGMVGLKSLRGGEATQVERPLADVSSWAAELRNA